MENNIIPFEKLNIIDDYMANAAASDSVVGRDFVRVLVEGLLQIKLGDNFQVNIQRVIVGDSPLKRGIRVEIEVSEYESGAFATNPTNVYDIEPNKRKNLDVTKHNRFYQAKIDSRNLEVGEKEFARLPNLFVMMITNYDPFGYDYMLYTVRNQCVELPELEYDDGLRFLYFNTTGTLGGSQELKQLLTYIEDSNLDNVANDVIKKLHEYVCQVKESPEVRAGYMMWEEKIFYERLDAKVEGIAEERIRAIKKKLEKHKTIEQIADELEITEEEVKECIEKIEKKEE